MSIANIRAVLERPFAEVSWKIQATNAAKDKGMVVAYIDARDVATRLDETGLPWSDSYSVLVMATHWVVECRLTIDGVTRTDVGTGEGDEAAKSAYSDAFKRAAVKFGVGRYLYDLPSSWVSVETVGRSQVIGKETMEKLQTAYRQKYGGQQVSSAPEFNPAVGRSSGGIQKPEGGGGGGGGGQRTLAQQVAEPKPVEPRTDLITKQQTADLSKAIKACGIDSEPKENVRKFLGWLLGADQAVDVLTLSRDHAQTLLDKLATPKTGEAAWYAFCESQISVGLPE